MWPPLALRNIAIKFTEVYIALQINDSPPEQKREEIRRSRMNPRRGRLMCCQFSPDSVTRASYAVVAGKGKLNSTGSGGWIPLFNACQWELFHKDSRFIDAGCLGCSSNTYANRLS